ncbi:TatD-related DNase [Flavobacterium cauense R2A-7]|uniref:TatD DNase family protein n=1 Tax=Flavobacterium cauense R2A-7 TaxID=1341154 RepID=V6S4D4_9FLAO|nr:TatD family hydrolase [Flavobacterium cauense]ESU19215.1 TatD-related DNase [Flavobacterium cauense R2A-7]KGO82163.1 hydrolase TatD [Flavobacterium cauense R2A-7]TWI15115.1 TatD DNase family protein [Flavobacterium cauense R2A-7]
MKYNIHTHKSTNQDNVLEIVNQYPNEFDDSVTYFSIGIHPWYIDVDRVDEYLQIIDEKLQLKNCLALGECGLDKRIETPLEIQTEIFEKQLHLAVKHQKPVVLHCVSAYQEVIEIKKRLNIEVPMIIHGFSKNWQVAKSLLDNGFYLSFGKYLLRNPELSTVFEQVPNNRFFLETDTIEEGINDVYIKAASIKNIDVEQIIEDNFKLVFNP